MVKIKTRRSNSSEGQPEPVPKIYSVIQRPRAKGKRLTIQDIIKGLMEEDPSYPHLKADLSVYKQISRRTKSTFGKSARL